MNSPTHPRIQVLFNLMEQILDGAQAARKLARKAHRLQKRGARGATLRPGPDTPLWNELAGIVRGLLVKRGQKANLARFLGIPRQRLHQYLIQQNACPDAERTLLLLTWVCARRGGITLS